VNTLAGIDAKLLGVVLNRVPQAAAVARGYGYGYKADLGREPIPPVGNGAGRRGARRRRRHSAEAEGEAA
jgi:hypothetical protein